jgi:hypothetical protein
MADKRYDQIAAGTISGTDIFLLADPATGALKKVTVNDLLDEVPAGGTGTVLSVSSGTGITVDNTDPANPIVSANPGAATSLAVGTTPITSGTLGALLFQGAGNVVAENGTNLLWDNASKKFTVKGGAIDSTSSFHWENSDGSQSFELRNDGSIWRNGQIYSYQDSVLNNTTWGLQAGGGFSPAGTADGNVCIGDNAGGHMPDGKGNIVIGNSSLNQGITGQLNHNIAIGEISLNAKVSGNYCIAIGWLAGAANSNKEGTIYLGIGADGNFNGSIAIGTTALITADGQLSIGSTGYPITHERHAYSGSGFHEVYYRTSTPEGAQAAPRGSVCYVDDGSTGSMYVKKTGTSSTGWALVLT